MMNNGLVCLIGVGTVFVGLVCLVAICYALSRVCRVFFGETPQVKEVEAPINTVDTPIENKQEIIAGVCAVIAEELGTDVTNIKVTSFKKV